MSYLRLLYGTVPEDTIRKKILAMDSKTNDMVEATRQLMRSEWENKKVVKLFKNSYTLIDDSKAEFSDTMDKIERIQIALNSVSPLRFQAIERFESIYNASFVETMNTTESVFTYDTVLTPSIKVKVHINGAYIPVRALMQTEESFHLMTDKCRQKLNLPLRPLNESDSLPENLTDILGVTEITFSPHYSPTPTTTLEVYVSQNSFAVTPVDKVHPSIKEHLSNFRLADPDFDTPGEVDLILNSLPLPNYLDSDQEYRVPGTHCSVYDTVFGWPVVGRAPVHKVKPSPWAQRILDRIAKKIEESDRYFRSIGPNVRFFK